MYIIRRFFAATFLVAVFSVSGVSNAATITTSFDYSGDVTVINQGLFVQKSRITGHLAIEVTGTNINSLSTTASGTAMLDGDSFFFSLTNVTVLTLTTVKADWLLINTDPSFPVNEPFSVIWDTSGIVHALSLGMMVGDTISGNELIRGGTTIATLDSAIPTADAIVPGGIGFAPFATISSDPMTTGPFSGLSFSMDIGTPNSMTVTSIETVSAVPVPPAVWLFGSGLIGLIGIAKRKKA